jgi:hypothetical protein
MFDLSAFAPDEAACFCYFRDGNQPGNGGTSDQSPRGVAYSIGTCMSIQANQATGWEALHKAAKTDAERAHCAAMVMHWRHKLDLWARTHARIWACLDSAAASHNAAATA